MNETSYPNFIIIGNVNVPEFSSSYSNDIWVDKLAKRVESLMKNRDTPTTRGIVATIWDNQSDPIINPIISYLFDTTSNSTRKKIINDAKTKFQSWMPYLLIIRYDENNLDYKSAKLKELVNGVYKAEETNIYDTITQAINNYFSGGGQVVIESKFYYDSEGNIIDSEYARNKICFNKENREAKTPQHSIDKSPYINFLNMVQLQEFEVISISEKRNSLSSSTINIEEGRLFTISQNELFTICVYENSCNLNRASIVFKLPTANYDKVIHIITKFFSSNLHNKRHLLISGKTAINIYYHGRIFHNSFYNWQKAIKSLSQFKCPYP